MPVYGAAKPVSTTTATAGEGRINLAGAGIDQGGDTHGAYHSFAVRPRARCVRREAAGLHRRDPRAAAPTARPTGPATCSTSAREARCGACGSASATYGDWANIGNVNIPYVDYDVDGDSVPDFETYLQNIEGTDLLYAWTVDLVSGDLVDLEPVNFTDG